LPLLVGAGAGLLVTAVRTAVLRSGAWPAFGAATDRSNGRALGALPDADLWWVAALPALSEVPPPPALMGAEGRWSSVRILVRVGVGTDAETIIGTTIHALDLRGRVQTKAW